MKEKVVLFRISKQIKNERQNAVWRKYVEDCRGDIKVEKTEIIDRQWKYFRGLLNLQNEY